MTKLRIRNRSKGRSLSAPTSQNSVDGSYQELLQKWTLQILVEMNGHRKFIDKNGFEHMSVVQLLGLDEYALDFKENTREIVLKKLIADYKGQEKSLESIPVNSELRTNLLLLADKIELSNVEVKALEFWVLLETTTALEDALDTLGDLSFNAYVQVLSKLLNETEQDIKKLFLPDALLIKLGIIRVDKTAKRSFDSIVNIENQTAIGRLLDHVDSIDEVFVDVIRKVNGCNLTKDDYRHIERSFNFSVNYLKSVMNDESSAGHNILVYGSSGTGKTEFAKLLAKTLGVELYEVASNDADSDTLRPRLRWKAFVTAQSLLRKKQSLILFDEIEDIFNDGGLFQSSTADGMKAEINNTLENNSVPSIWITNDVSVMDQAFLRRFDIVLEMNVPPRSQRLRMLKDRCGDLIDDKTLDQIADCKHLSPAIIDRAKAVMSRNTGDGNSDGSHQFLHLINQTLHAQGYKKIAIHPDNRGAIYSLDLLNTDANMEDIMQGVKTNGSARICLYGPSGTGKSEYVHWLAKTLDRPLVQKKGSDLISKWLGETERNIATAFEEAEEDNAVLLLDEIDSFLQDRRHSVRSWEVTQVNELLTQMESFNGLLVATTNLVDTMDKAALRRFDAKVKFNYLTEEQRLVAFMNLCAEMELTHPHRQYENQLHHLDNLTVGDFASIRRRNRFSPIRKTNDLMNALILESELKSGGHQRKIGFH